MISLQQAVKMIQFCISRKLPASSVPENQNTVLADNISSRLQIFTTKTHSHNKKQNTLQYHTLHFLISLFNHL